MLLPGLPFPGLVGASVGGAVNGFVSGASNTSGSFAGMSLGSPAADRQIIACVTWANAAGTTQTNIADATLTPSGESGIAGTPLYRHATASYRNVEFWGFDVPAGATGELSCSFAAGADRRAVALFAVYGLSTLTPSATGTATFGSFPSLAIPAGGFMIAGKTANSDATDRTFTNMTLVYANTSSPREMFGYKESIAGETFQPVLDNTGGASTMRSAAATWGP